MIYPSNTRAIQLNAEGLDNNPFIAWANLAKGKTYSGTTTLADGSAANAFAGTTYDYWMPDVSGATATLIVDMGAATACDFAALAAHNLKDWGATVALAHSPDNSTYTDCGVGTVTPGDNGPVVFRFGSTSRRYWRWTFGGLTAGDDIAVGVAFLGAETVIPRRFYQGFSPVITPTEVQLQSNVSVGGNLLGSTVIGTGSVVSATVNNVDPVFIRGAAFLDFMAKFNRGQPFFFGWRPVKYPGDVHYCWRDGAVIRPTNSGPRDLMSFALECRAYDG